MAMCDRRGEGGVKSLCGNLKLSAPKALSNLKTLRTYGAKPCQPSPLHVKNRTMEHVHGAVFYASASFSWDRKILAPPLAGCRRPVTVKPAAVRVFSLFFPIAKRGRGPVRERSSLV